MNFKKLIANSELRAFAMTDLELPAIPADGKRLLGEIVRHQPSGYAAFVQQQRFEETLELTSYPLASGPWFADRGIRFLIWEGDLVIDGDLMDDDFTLLPLLIVRGDLYVRNWLRGGMPGFVGRNVCASGFIVGHYNDSALFVGGDLSAAGYVRRAKPYPEFREIVPHQIAGQVNARVFDLNTASDDELRAAFVDEVVAEEGEDVWLDERLVLERSNAGLPVWRQR